MLKKILLAFAMFYGAMAFAAVDVNKATAAELDGIKGIGPAKSGAIMAERKKGEFKDWNDLIKRVKGIGEGNASKYSAEGLTVAGASYKGPAKAGADKKDDKKTAAKEEPKKAEMKKDDSKTVATAAKPAASAAKK